MDITLNLQLQEVNAVLDMLGQLPTSTNVWPLAAKIRGQAEQQMLAAQASQPLQEAA
jgi:hypothetical protein